MFAIAGAAAIGAGAVSAPLQVALVEDISGHPASVQLMDYVEPGQVIRLGPGDTIVLGYLLLRAGDDHRRYRDRRYRAQ